MPRRGFILHRVICFLIISNRSILYSKMVWDNELRINDLKFHVNTLLLWDSRETFSRYHDNDNRRWAELPVTEHHVTVIVYVHILPRNCCLL